MCGNHTNNYAEIRVRLYKVIVLSRCKAYNVPALVDFTCTVMEKYYVCRLRSFASSHEIAPRLLLQALLKTAEYLNTDNITRVTAFTYLVPSERSDEKYEVDISVGICMCEAGNMEVLQTSGRDFEMFLTSSPKCTWWLLLKQGTG